MTKVLNMAKGGLRPIGEAPSGNDLILVTVGVSEHPARRAGGVWRKDGDVQEWSADEIVGWRLARPGPGTWSTGFSSCWVD